MTIKEWMEKIATGLEAWTPYAIYPAYENVWFDTRHNPFYVLSCEKVAIAGEKQTADASPITAQFQVMFYYDPHTATDDAAMLADIDTLATDGIASLDYGAVVVKRGAMGYDKTMHRKTVAFTFELMGVIRMEAIEDAN